MPKVLNIPIVEQKADYTCGAAVVRSILQSFKMDVSEDKLAKLLDVSTEDGIANTNIVNFLNYIVFSDSKANLTIEQLKENLDKGHPVIIALQAYSKNDKDHWGYGHYSIAIGYDNKNIYFMDPGDKAYSYLPTKEFSDRWHFLDGKELVHFGIIVHHKFNTIDIDKFNKMP